ncbi:putative ribonuclease H-like domain-containing protein [Tanacetum coccineum]
MNKLVKGNLVRGLPSKIFENDHPCVACQKGKKHKASYKAKLVNSIGKPLHILHMDLFVPTNVKSLMKKSYCLVVTGDFSRFSWNGVAERKNRTLIEAARTMLVDSKLPTTFWAEAVNTACYVLNKVLVIKPHNKTPCELIRGRTPLIDFMNLLGPKDSKEDAGVKPTEVDESEASDKDGKVEQDSRSEFERLLQQEKHIEHPNNTNSFNTVGTHVSTTGPSFSNEDPSSPVNAAEASNAFKNHLFE